MRILMLHNRYNVRGGEDESTDCEFRLLRDRGHHVELLESNNAEIGQSISKMEAAVSALWSRRWGKRVAQALQDGRFDILHVQNFFPLISPSVYWAASAAGVPVVQAVRNYRLVCPSANLFRDGDICTDCLGTTLKLPGIRHGCYRGSSIGSAAVAAVSAGHWALGTWRHKVTSFAAISQYVRRTLLEDGFPSERVLVKPNFVEVSGALVPKPADERGHILFVGRLTREKGLDLLIHAFRAAGVNVPLKLVGEGNLDGLSEIQGVEVLGRRPLADVYRLMADAFCVVMPGRWPEPFGRVAIEAFAAGTPVIASAAGGVAEIVRNDENGFLVPAGDVVGLADRLRQIVDEPALFDRLAFAALRDFRKFYSADSNYRALVDIYRQAVSTQQK